MTDKSELPMALRAAYMALHRSTDNAFAKHGITADQFVLLATLVRGGAMTQRELARQMPSDPSTVRAMLVLLEKQGLIERENHPTDLRAHLVSLTAAGKRKFKLLWKAGDAIRDSMVHGLTSEELSYLICTLKKLTTVLAPDHTQELVKPARSKTTSKRKSQATP